VRTQHGQQGGEYRQGAHHDAGDRPARQPAAAAAAVGTRFQVRTRAFARQTAGMMLDDD